MTDHVPDASADPGPEVVRARQAELYGAPIDALLAAVEEHAGLGAADVAGVIGVSVPMLSRVRDGRRTRLGNPVAVARLAMLRELAGHVAAGVADPADVPLAVAQIAVATGPAGPGGPTSVGSRAPGGSASVGSRAPSGSSGGSGGDPAAASPLTHASLRAARERVGVHVPPSAALRWPLLERLTGTETWVKHENHNPTGAFKVRGGLNFVARTLADLREAGPASGARPHGLAGLVTASRGNHSQSLAFAGGVYDVPVTVVVPEGNSPDKNEATLALGAELVVHGADFQEAVEHAARLAEERGLLMVPPFHPYLVEGVATYAAELHESVPGLDVLYVPIGMGSGACASVWVRDLIGASTEIVGVVADAAPAYALSVEAGVVVTTPTADTFVDGVACRTPDPGAVAILHRGLARVLRVGEDAAAEAMALMYRCTHNLAEPAGALALAGLLAERDRVAGRRVAVVHCGGNADFEVLARVMG